MSLDPRMFSYFKCPECGCKWRVPDAAAWDSCPTFSWEDVLCENCATEAELDARAENEMEEAMKRTVEI